jgi:hypothetical protein
VLSEQTGIGDVHRHAEQKRQPHANTARLVHAPENDHQRQPVRHAGQAAVGRKFSSNASSQAQADEPRPNRQQNAR